MKTTVRGLVTLGLSLITVGAASAAGFRWSDHRPPYDFLFGNHIDTHLETKLNTDGTLSGFFYVVQLDQDGDGLPDTSEDGRPIMRHCTEPGHYPNCQVGWLVKAAPCIEEVNGCTAMFLYHQHDHPVWLIGPRLRTMDGDTFLGGRRALIPQPGSPVHYHWLTEGSDREMDGNITFFPSSIEDLEALFDVDIEVDPRCNVNTAGELETGVICPGYFLEIKALAVGGVYQAAPGSEWLFHHGGENIPVSPGIDESTHTNFVTSYQAVEVPADDLPPDDGGMGGGDHDNGGGDHGNGGNGGGSHE